MTKKLLSPEEIAEMSEDCQCSCKELEQYKAWWERDSTALGKALNEVSSLRAGKEQFRAAIEQLHAAVKTAQELAATRLMEVNRLQTYNVAQGTLLLTVQQDNERLRGEAEVADEQLAQLRGFAEAHKTCRGSDEPLPVASRDADHCDYPDCEHHWELVIDWALAAMKKLHESAEPDTDHPEIPAIIPAAAFRAFVDEHARLMRIRASAPQGASRDASSEPCEHLRSELLAEKLSAEPPFEMRKCLDCTKIFRKRLTVKSGGSREG